MLDRVGFTSWLAEHDPDDVAGLCGDPGACPIGMYLCYGTPQGILIHVGRREYRGRFPNMAERQFPMPLWATRFVVMADAEGGRMTFGRCLEIMAHVDY